eukprot:m.16710 g.16710  ORF g.16710 m.16710 type:complete len:753 (+) comp3417_c0_seq1:102-2360(+)
MLTMLTLALARLAVTGRESVDTDRTATTTTRAVTLNGCECAETWTPPATTCGNGTTDSYRGCGMVLPCDGNNAGVCGRSWCVINETQARITPSCHPAGARDGWDYCMPPLDAMTEPVWLGPFEHLAPETSSSNSSGGGGGGPRSNGSCTNLTVRHGLDEQACRAWCQSTPNCSAVTFGAAATTTSGNASTWTPCTQWWCDGIPSTVSEAARTSANLTLAVIAREPECCVARGPSGDDDRPCIFPFRYNRAEYTNCTTVPTPTVRPHRLADNVGTATGGEAWCATAIVPSTREVIQWRTCSCSPLASLPWVRNASHPPTAPPTHHSTTTRAPTHPHTATTRAPTHHHHPPSGPPSPASNDQGMKVWHQTVFFIGILVVGGLLLLIGIVFAGRAARKRWSSSDPIVYEGGEGQSRRMWRSRGKSGGYSLLEIPVEAGGPTDDDDELLDGGSSKHRLSADTRTLRDFLNSTESTSPASPVDDGTASDGSVGGGSGGSHSNSLLLAVNGGGRPQPGQSPCESGLHSGRSSRRGSFSNLSVNHVYEGPNTPALSVSGTSTPATRASSPRGAVNGAGGVHGAAGGGSLAIGHALRAQLEGEMMAARPAAGAGIHGDLASIRRSVRSARSRTTSQSSSVSWNPAQSRWSDLRWAIKTGDWKHKVPTMSAVSETTPTPSLESTATATTLSSSSASRQWDMLCGVINDGIRQRRLGDLLGTSTDGTTMVGGGGDMHADKHADNASFQSDPSSSWGMASTHD